MDDNKTRDVLAYLLVFAILVIPICKGTVPDRLWDMAFMAVSFFFAANRNKPLDVKDEPKKEVTNVG